MYGRESYDVVNREYTWTEWLDAAEKGEPDMPDTYKEPSTWTSGNDREHWLGDGSFADTFKAASGDGYRRAIVDAEKLVAHIETDLGYAMVNDFQATYDVAGAEVDMGRFMAGEPECMVESLPMKVMRTGRVVKIAVPVCYPSTINAETVLARGAAVMALVNAFAMMQHPVEIYATTNIHGNWSKRNGTDGKQTSPRLSYSVRVQDADQPLNMGRVMYALAHPTMLRHLSFAVEHTEDEKVRGYFGVGGSYGHPSYECRIDDLNINVENAIILPPLMSNYGWSESESVAWITQQLAKIREGAN